MALRPVFVQLTARFSKETRSIFWAPIRMPGSTRSATRDELRALFAEQRPAQPAEALWNLEAPRIPHAADGTDDPAADFALRSGLIVPAGPAAWGRPISERTLGELARGLDGSALAQALAGLTGSADPGVNRSNTATLVWRLGAGEPAAFEMTAQIEVPGHHGHSHVEALQLTLTMVSRLTARLECQSAGHAAQATAGNRRMGGAARFGRIHPHQPGRGRAVCRSGGHRRDHRPAAACPSHRQRASLPDLLPARLSPIRDGGVSHGAHMLADPALDLSEPADRGEQVDRWLVQMAADAGLTGMEQLISEMRR